MRRECRERFPRHRFQRKPLVNDSDMHHCMHVGIATPGWRGKRSQHSRRMRNPHFCVSCKRPIGVWSLNASYSLQYIFGRIAWCATVLQAFFCTQLWGQFRVALVVHLRWKALLRVPVGWPPCLCNCTKDTQIKTNIHMYIQVHMPLCMYTDQ